MHHWLWARRGTLGLQTVGIQNSWALWNCGTVGVSNAWYLNIHYHYTPATVTVTQYYVVITWTCFWVMDWLALWCHLLICQAGLYPLFCVFSLQMACRSHVLRTWLSLTSHNVMMLYLQHHGSIIWTSFFAMCHWKLNCSGTESRNKPWIPEVRGQISTLHSSFSHIFFPHSPVQRLQDNFVLYCTEDLLDYINTFPQYTGHSSIFGSVYGVIRQINAQVHQESL